MADSATNASENGSNDPKTRDDDRLTLEHPARIIERIEAWANDHPEAVDYWIDTEIEAASLLLAMAASLKHAEQDIADRISIETLRRYANTYRQHVQQGKALYYLRKLCEGDEDLITLHGLTIRASRIVQ
jgi:hypothetical protein